MTLGLDLAWRGVTALVVDPREGPVGYPRCNNVAARTMEHYRRLGIADQIRRAGLPPGHPTDVVYRVRYGGPEYCRFSYPPSREVLDGSWKSDFWPTAEPNHKVNQLHFEPILEERLGELAGIDLLRGVRLEGYHQLDDHVEVDLLEKATGRRTREQARYIVGCDGGSSTVRRAMGVSLVGDTALNHHQYSMYVRSRELAASSPDRVWMALVRNHEGTYTVIAVDGVETFLIHVALPADQPDKPVDQSEVLSRIVGGPVEFEILADTRWAGQAIVAERYRDRRAFLAGDAAHLWTPYAGFGMNTGIGDAIDLSWKVWAVLNGWAPDSLLDSYEIERRPIGERVARAIISGFKQSRELLRVGPICADDTPEGREERRRIGELITAQDRSQFDCTGLNFGIDYADSPIVWPDGSKPPPFEIGSYTPSTTPGCRLPHLWLRDGRALYDVLGPGFTLLVLGAGAGAGIGGIIDAAARRGLPLEVVTVDEPGAADLLSAPLLLVRPDQHVSWRGDHLPDAGTLLDRVTGVEACPGEWKTVASSISSTVG
ncbi:FAD-dependent monooxygenase [Mycobacterium mantenii]|nr:FAD-dependent monooxygenase [Mycobacterium mantenii]MCV7246155.1 FAD-dependent monooxygenase [Mycobacterium mantenii]